MNELPSNVIALPVAPKPTPTPRRPFLDVTFNDLSKLAEFKPLAKFFEALHELRVEVPGDPDTSEMRAQNVRCGSIFPCIDDKGFMHLDIMLLDIDLKDEIAEQLLQTIVKKK
jgi:hypothetical protein